MLFFKFSSLHFLLQLLKRLDRRLNNTRRLINALSYNIYKYFLNIVPPSPMMFLCLNLVQGWSGHRGSLI